MSRALVVLAAAVALAAALWPSPAPPPPPAPPPSPPPTPRRAPATSASAPRPAEAVRLEGPAPSTWIVQLEVGHGAARVLGAVHKPRLPYRGGQAAGAFEVRAVDAAGRTSATAVDVRGLLPEGVPAAWLDERGAWARGDEVLLPALPVLVKLPGALASPVEVEVRGPDGRVLGRGRF